MRRYFYAIVLCILGGVLAAHAVDQTSAKSFKEVEALAMHGDYQAQRNLAYGYAAWPYEGQQKNPLLACAWYLVVLNSGSKQIDSGDTGNVRVNCEKLDAKSQAAAVGQARALYKQVYKSEAKF